MYSQNSENKTTLINFEGLDVDKMDYLLRDAAALRINLKWEVGPDLTLKFLFCPFHAFVAFFNLQNYLSKPFFFSWSGFWKQGNQS